jgi:predicted transcriptional regulator
MYEDPRQRAALESAVEELERFDLIKAEGAKRETFSITNKGYQVADTIKAHKNPTPGPAGANELDVADISILKTIGDIDGSGAVPNDIIERIGLKGKLNVEELEDRLDHLETTTGYIKNRWATSTDSKGIYQTELTAKGREFVRRLSS